MTDRTITIGFAVFCLTCESQLRNADVGDFVNSVSFCPECGTERKIACGISIMTDYKDELRWAYQEMRKHAELVTLVLFGKFGPHQGEV